MASLPTSSFRAPAEHHALVHSVAKALTRRPDLAEPLNELLAQVADVTAAPEPLRDVLRRLDAAERLLAEYGALLAARALPSADTGTGPEEETAPAEEYIGQGEPLNFRVSPAFRQRFRVYAVAQNVKQSELLVLAFEALLREQRLA